MINRNYHLVATNHAGVAPIALAEKRGNSGVILPLLDCYRQNVLRNSLDTSGHKGRPANNISCGYCNGLVQKYHSRLEKYAASSLATPPVLKYARTDFDPRRPGDNGKFLQVDDDPFRGRNQPKPKFRVPTMDEIQAEIGPPVRFHDLQPPPPPSRSQPRRWQDVAVEEQQERIRRFDQMSQTMPANVNGFHFRHAERSQPPTNFSATATFSNTESVGSVPQPSASGRHAGARQDFVYSQQSNDPPYNPSNPPTAPTLRHHSSSVTRDVSGFNQFQSTSHANPSSTSNGDASTATNSTASSSSGVEEKFEKYFGYLR